MIRPATRDDIGFIQELSMVVFSRFGEYDRILTDYFIAEDVKTYVYEEESGDGACFRSGFLMLGAGMDVAAKRVHVCIHAIAVTPRRQRSGIGSEFMSFAKSWAMGIPLPVEEIRLSVAEDNHAARGFFEKHGFLVAGAERWEYPMGQKALRMVLRLEALKSVPPGETEAPWTRT